MLWEGLGGHRTTIGLTKESDEGKCNLTLPIQSGVLPDLDNADRTFYEKKPILEISSIRQNTMEKSESHV